MKTCALAIMAMILMVMFPVPLFSETMDVHGFKRVAIILVPGISYNDLLMHYSNSTVLDLNKSSITLVYPSPPYNSLYYELSIVNGAFWDLEKGVPLSNNTILVFRNNTAVIEYPWMVINQSLVNSIWVTWKTIFIGVRSIDVNKVNSTVNFYYNLSKKVIHPAIFKIRVNSTITWDYINESISLIEENNTLVLKVANETSTVKDNVTDIITINVTNSKYLQQGLYDLKFYVFKIDNETYKVVTLGTILRDHGFSKNVIGFDRPVTPHIPLNILDQLTINETIVLIKDVGAFYKELINYVVSEAGLPESLILYCPIFEEILVNLNHNISVNVSKEVISVIYDVLEEIVRTIYERLGDETLIVIFSPYTVAYNETANEIIPQEYIIGPGVVKYEKTVIETLISNNIDFKLVNIDGYKLIIVDDYTIPYNGLSYSEGVVVLLKTGIKPPLRHVESATVLSYLISIPNTLGYNSIVLFAKYHDLTVEYSRLKTEYEILNSTANDLRRELNETKKKLGDVNAEYEDLLSKIVELEDQLNKEKERARSLMVYLTAGLSSILVLTLVYVVIIRNIVKKLRR